MGLQDLSTEAYAGRIAEVRTIEHQLAGLLDRAEPLGCDLLVVLHEKPGEWKWADVAAVDGDLRACARRAGKVT